MLSGRSIIGVHEGKGAGEVFHAFNPATGQPLEPEFFPASGEEVDAAARLAHQAFASYSRLPGRARGALLRNIADRIESIAGEIVDRAHLETALPKARLQGETARTCGQLRLFAHVVEEGSWVDARIDRANPDRKPAPKPDIRSMLRPLGPVVVFGASNFPLAFSVAGGDTASALAAGNPVIVKGHGAHPGTGELVGRAVQESVRDCGLPEGVFSLLFGAGSRVGAALVKHPLVKAVGFTGSRTAGRILMDLGAARPEPIPVYAEMSSTNPVFILSGALRERAETMAAGLHGSFTLGAGQFCTKPGIVFLPESAGAAVFVDKLKQLVEESAPFHLLTGVIHSSFRESVAGRRTTDGVSVVAEKPAGVQSNEFSAGATLFETDAATFLQNPGLECEIFGPATQLVRNATREQLLEAAGNLEGHLTATILGTDDDLRDYKELVAILENKVGRLVVNGFPTGVEVGHAMVHGGPYPSTSDGRSTSVGSRAIFRFTRSICYQGFPDAALPDEVKDSNPLGIWRMVDGEMTREALSPAAKVKIA